MKLREVGDREKPPTLPLPTVKVTGMATPVMPAEGAILTVPV
jgi:hypothetical protein